MKMVGGSGIRMERGRQINGYISVDIGIILEKMVIERLAGLI